jgi:glyoxylase-like metal-dependent hydrolase (beta-lactamase superfamily II)
MALWLDFAHHRGEPFQVDHTLAHGERFRAGGVEWLAMQAPGHDMGALVFHCEEAKLLISGDALWEQSFGLILPEPPEALPAARATLESIDALDIDWVLPGHGPMFSNVKAAIDRAMARIAYFEQDPKRLASHSIKAMFGFMLLDRGRLPLAAMEEMLQNIPVSATLNAKHLGMSPAELADWLVSQIEKAGIGYREDGWLISANRR